MPENDRTDGRIGAELDEMHTDRPLAAPVKEPVKPVATEPDEFGRTPEQLKEIQSKHDQAFEEQDKLDTARNNHIEALADVHDSVRDRTLAVQEEISTRERDGAMPGTPAFERRKARIREIVGQTEDDEAKREKDHANRLEVIVATLNTRSPSGIEIAQRELMAVIADMRGDADGSKGAKEREDARIKAAQEAAKHPVAA